jgi:hypothetical protein
MTRQPFLLRQFQFFLDGQGTLPGVFAELDKLNLAHAAELPAKGFESVVLQADHRKPPGEERGR